MGDEQTKKENLIEDVKRRLTSRKLHVAVVGFIAATFFFYYGMLSGALWVELLKWIFGLYSVGNVGEHFADAAKKHVREGM